MNTEQDILVRSLAQENAKLTYMLLDSEYRITLLERITALLGAISPEVMGRLRNESIAALQAKYPEANIKLNNVTADNPE